VDRGHGLHHDEHPRDRRDHRPRRGLAALRSDGRDPAVRWHRRDLGARPALVLFGGPVVRAATFPLPVWLPDAMAGPTPVSALIHAATMVAAGVYLIGRMFEVFMHADPAALTFVSIIAAITMLGAALLAIAQDDIKRVLAYSTLSQLAY